MHPLLLSIVAQRNRSGATPLPGPGIPLMDAGLWEWTTGNTTDTSVFYETPSFDGSLYSGGFVSQKISAAVSGTAVLSLKSIGTWAVNFPAGQFYVVMQRTQSGSGITVSPLLSTAVKGASQIFGLSGWNLNSPQANSGTYLQERSGSYPTNTGQFQVDLTQYVQKTTRVNLFVFYTPA